MDLIKLSANEAFKMMEEGVFHLKSMLKHF